MFFLYSASLNTSVNMVPEPRNPLVARVTRRLSLVDQELLTVPEHLSSPLAFSGVRVTRSLVLCVFCRSLFFPLSVFFCAIVLSNLRFTDSDYIIGIFRLFLMEVITQSPAEYDREIYLQLYNQQHPFFSRHLLLHSFKWYLRNNSTVFEEPGGVNCGFDGRKCSIYYKLIIHFYAQY